MSKPTSQAINELKKTEENMQRDLQRTQELTKNSKYSGFISSFHQKRKLEQIKEITQAQETTPEDDTNMRKFSRS